MSLHQSKKRLRIIVALAIFACVFVFAEFFPVAQLVGGDINALYLEFGLFLIPYLLAGYDVLYKALRNIGNGQIFDENFLMSIATIGAFALVLFPGSDPHMAEGAAVMLFYQVGELFQDYAVDKSRASIAEMMDIAADFAYVMKNGELVKVDPYELSPGDEFVVKPGDRIALDGVIVEGTSQLDTSALTGESVPRHVETGEDVISGCINMSGVLTIRATKPFEESTVSRILELVEEASEKKAHTENFITRFARYYTPVVTIGALVIALLPPLLFGFAWADWVERGLTFLVVSCPCALVISVPLSFFGGIGGASRLGILVKGGNYLEALAKADTVVFDKTGTLTKGAFKVVAIHPEKQLKNESKQSSELDPEYLLSLAAHAEAYSNHPIALSIKEAYSGEIDSTRIEEVAEKGGHGVRALVDNHVVLIGNDKLMAEARVAYHDCTMVGTILHVALDGEYVGHIVIADVVKPEAKQAISMFHDAGVTKTVMLTGDRAEVAQAVARDLGIDEVHAQLLPQEKVSEVEKLLAREGKKEKLAFVGDGINDAPVLTRADIGIAMGAMGSDAAIEAADVVLMDDDPRNISRAIHISRKTMRIVWQNIIFALGIKFAVLILAAVGIATMWLAVFADVGVAVLAILNAMRCMKVKK